MAQTAGDETSHREYLRLDCAYGHDSKSCQELGLALRREGDQKHAIPYLRKACGVLPDTHRIFREACAAVGSAQ